MFRKYQTLNVTGIEGHHVALAPIGSNAAVLATFTEDQRDRLEEVLNANPYGPRSINVELAVSAIESEAAEKRAVDKIVKRETGE
jgi:hypothetical protein